MSDYSKIFGHEPEPWREPLGALRLTIWDAPTDFIEWKKRLRLQVEELVKVLDEHGSQHVYVAEAGNTLDNEPCPVCGGDVLRTNFTGSGACHAGGTL